MKHTVKDRQEITAETVFRKVNRNKIQRKTILQTACGKIELCTLRSLEYPPLGLTFTFCNRLDP